MVKAGIERAILTLALRDKSILYEVFSEGIKGIHFGIKGNNVIYTVISHLVFNEGVESLDAMLIYNTIPVDTKEFVDELGGIEYIESLFKSCIVNNLAIYVKQLKEAYKTRKVIELMNKSLEDIEDLKGFEEVMGEFDLKVSELMLEGNKSKTYKVGTSMEERLKERAENPKDIYGYKIGWNKFDRISQGFQSNDLVVVVGESKTGKSTLLTNWTNILVKSGLCGVYFDTEMDDEEFDDRLLSIESSVPFEEIRNGKYSIDTEYGTAQNKMLAIKEAIERIKEYKLFHEYIPEFNMESVMSLSKKHKKENNVDFIVFDYIKMPKEDMGKQKNTNEYEKLGYITTCLKDLAGMLKIPILTACQSNRSQIGNTDPDAGSIQGSYKILQLASKLYFIRNKTDYELTSEGYRFGNQVLHIKFQRHGGAGENINIQFDKAICKQKEVSE